MQMSNVNHHTYCFIFICQPGELEIKSMLLAASLRLHLGAEVELVAAIPGNISCKDDLDPNTLKVIEALNIRTESIESRNNDNYFLGNKVACLGVETEAEKIVLLDSDLLCLGKLPKNCFPAPVSVKTAEISATDWKNLYRTLGLSLPKRRVSATLTGDTMLPYFNTGVIAIDNGIDLSSVWEKYCILINKETDISCKGHSLEQIALPVAIESLGLEFNCLGEEMNYPADLKLLPGNLPIFCHYHLPGIIRREPGLNLCVQQLAQKHSSLQKLIESSGPEWKKLLDHSRFSNYRKKFALKHLFPSSEKKHSGSDLEDISNFPDLIITGISRSGTSLLCRLLSELPDTVIINEPNEIFRPLTDGYPPEWMATFYRELRVKILDGEEIENKVVNGQLVDDTLITDKREPFCPKVNRPDFILGTKNTMAYLSRLSLLKRAMPGAPIIACIRHPLDTIASWKDSFPHLVNVDFEKFPVNFTDNQFLTGAEKSRLDEIAACKDLTFKHALLWRHLIEVIKEHEDRLCVIRYEDLIENSSHEIGKIISLLGTDLRVSAAKENLSPRSKRDSLSREEIQVISDICGESARYFKYRI